MSEWLVALLASLPGATAAIWLWWTKVYLPAKQAQEAIESERKYTQDIDQQEHLQQSQTDSLKALLEITKRLIDHLITLTDRQDEKLRDMRKQLSDIKTVNDLTLRDWSRVNEVIADIDLVMHRIETALKIGEYKDD